MSVTSEQSPVLERLRSQLLVRWKSFPRQEELDELLRAALVAAKANDVQVITVTSPVSRPARLRLAPLAKPADLDSFYHGEAAELCAADDGVCYLVYRRTDGGDYAVEWSSATLMPEQLMRGLPEVLAIAMFDGRD